MYKYYIIVVIIIRARARATRVYHPYGAFDPTTVVQTWTIRHNIIYIIIIILCARRNSLRHHPNRRRSPRAIGPLILAGDGGAFSTTGNRNNNNNNIIVVLGLLVASYSLFVLLRGEKPIKRPTVFLPFAITVSYRIGSHVFTNSGSFQKTRFSAHFVRYISRPTTVKTLVITCDIISILSWSDRFATKNMF